MIFENIDCFKALQELPENSIDSIISDPPYGVNFGKIQGDKTDDVLIWIPIFFKEAFRLLKDNSFMFLFVGVKHIEDWILEGQKAGFIFKNIIATRCFNNGSAIPKNNFGFQFQPILLFSKGRGKNFNQVDFIPTSAEWLKDKRNKNPKPFTYQYPNFIKTEWAFATAKRASKNFHPTEKNIKLIKFFIQLVTNPNEIILDPFAGSGSTGIAALECKRDFIGYEIDKKFYDIAKKRLKIS